MGVHDYRLVARWELLAPAERIYRCIERGRLGQRGFLPLNIQVHAEAVQRRAPYRLELRTSGDWAGHAVWTLEPRGARTCVRLEWKASARRPVWRGLGLIARPLVEWNFRRLLAHAEKQLQGRLQKQLGEDISRGAITGT